ncbi:MAG: aspartate carbamoyltransferase catalytic subunit [Candidatus Coatesbacteria bacterium]|nr:aspartate carbamoyltransferase catalytic subunit [Candidatus Coatesbacteria bacterium]
MPRKHLLGIADLSPFEISMILDLAESTKSISERTIKKVPTLRGRTILNLFFEPSTRTRLSFEIAQKRLSADTVNFSVSGSSVSKGETLVDTAKNLAAMRPSVIVIRHGVAGYPHRLAKLMDASVINAGDGFHEHPTQALLDLMTIRERKGQVEGLKVAIIGDIARSRVAGSNILCLSKMGAEVTVMAPRSMLPYHIKKTGVNVAANLKDAITNKDVVMALRIQRERDSVSRFPSLREYNRYYGLKMEHMQYLKDDCIIMHPGPINRGVEIDPEVADGPLSVILEQVSNGVAVRMAVLLLLLGGRNIYEVSD